MTKRYWRNRYKKLRTYQTKIYRMLECDIAPHLYTPKMLKKLKGKYSFPEDCFYAFELAVEEALENAGYGGYDNDQ